MHWVCADGIEEQGIQDLQLHLPSVEMADTHADTIAAMAVDLQTHLLETMHWVCADGIEEQGSSIMYKANVRKILTEGEGDKLKAVGVQLADGRTYRGQVDSVTVLCLPIVCKFDLVL